MKICAKDGDLALAARFVFEGRDWQERDGILREGWLQRWRES